MNHSELEKLYNLYAKELFFYALSFTKNKSDAEELVSDAFYQLAMQDIFPAHIKFWLFHVVKNKFIDNERKKKRWSFLNIDNLTLTDNKQTDLHLLTKESYYSLYQSINQLKQPYKEITLLFYFLEWSTKEISQYLHISVNQVRVNLHRSRKQLKEILKDDF